ncbi:hypothetical protein DL766_004200 [Monosporascus sp. MC13-8B]|uniref:MARVEL domain-containing protein n=1 Tax=Monosporascus cannonballus TaxID=155416 RepID=A0ABY0HNS6_9PEZI|nr:hypothetical protein DL762_000203 [Monosporascus cannonballus]RYP01474.1 hypothetical protein DL763_000137 [Monosporascus cannonballus]RYP31915.1 hypothetical protein DL766_004200 [Monosporascus sp. MC13-8B]
MEQPKIYSNQRPAGKEHIPLYPRGFVALRIVQLVVGLVCLGLCAYGVTVLAFSGDSLMLFTAVATLIASIYCLVAHFGPPTAYNYWAILGLDIFLLVFWLASFALLAAQVAPLLSYYSYYSSTYSEYYGYYTTYDAAVLTYAGILAGAAGLGGLEFILYIVSLSMHSVMVHRHRKAGLHCMPLESSSYPAPAGGKIEMQPQLQQPHPQLAPVYHPNSGNPPQNIHQYPQQSTASPVSPQPTGGSYAQGPPVSLNPHQSPYEADGHERR